MSRLAGRARASVASFGTALLPEECGGPASAQLVDRVERYLRQLPATSRLAMRAGLLSAGRGKLPHHRPVFGAAGPRPTR